MDKVLECELTDLKISMDQHSIDYPYLPKALIMETASASKTSRNFCQSTWCYNHIQLPS